MSDQRTEESGVNGVGTAKRDRAILALLTEPTLSRAAEIAGVCDKTLRRWLQEPAFLAEYRRARREAFAQAIAVTQRYAPAAVVTLAKIMGDPNAPYPSRVSAATSILKFSRDSIELDDLAARIEALERGAASPGSFRPSVFSGDWSPMGSGDDEPAGEAA